MGLFSPQNLASVGLQVGVTIFLISFAFNFFSNGINAFFDSAVVQNLFSRKDIFSLKFNKKNNIL